MSTSAVLVLVWVWVVVSAVLVFVLVLGSLLRSRTPVLASEASAGVSSAAVMMPVSGSATMWAL